MQVLYDTTLVKGIFAVDVAHGGLRIFQANVFHQRSYILPIGGRPASKATPHRMGAVQLRRIHASFLPDITQELHHTIDVQAVSAALLHKSPSAAPESRLR